MSWSQYAEAAGSLLATKLGLSDQSYRPDYTKSTVSHFAIHAGGVAAGLVWGRGPGVKGAAMLVRHARHESTRQAPLVLKGSPRQVVCGH